MLTLAGIGDEGMSVSSHGFFFCVFAVNRCIRASSIKSFNQLTVVFFLLTGKQVNIWGPSDLDFLAGAMRSFIPNRAMLHTHSFGTDRNASSPQSKDSIIILDDEVVRISAMFVKPRYHNGTGSSNDSDMKPGDTAIVYACELPEIKGKFDPSKAAALGLRPGPKYRELQLGNSVQSDQFDEMVSHE